MKSRLAYNLSSKQRWSLIVSTLLLISAVVYLNFFRKETIPTFTKVEFSEQEIKETEVLNLQDFNPNTLSANGWQNLGFSEKQVATILKYKDIVGGEFTSKAQLKKCYAISPEKYEQIESYILLPETKPSNKTFFTNNYSKKELNIPGKFNPDSYSLQNWINLGFSEKQSEGILKYKNYLGGSFVSKEKFKECFMISDENYAKLSPYLILPEKTPDSFNPYQKPAIKEKANIAYENFDPNLLNLDNWMKLGFSEKQAQNILNYKERNLRGSFKTLEDIARCYMISAEKFEQLKPFIQLNPENFSKKVPVNINEEKPTEKTDFSKTDLNRINYQQLQEYGFEDKAAASFVGFRKKLTGFVNKNQILETYNLDQNLTQKLINESMLSSSNVEKHSLRDAPESWLKNHPYFSSFADKIIFYRISENDEKKILKKLNLKPEQMEHMKLYLK